MCRAEREMVKLGRFYPDGVPGRFAGLLERVVVWRYGAVPGIMRVQFGDLRLMRGMSGLFKHLGMNNRSRLTTTQREMVATVVNGLVSGAP